jgi:hypothetical protein
MMGTPMKQADRRAQAIDRARRAANGDRSAFKEIGLLGSIIGRCQEFVRRLEDDGGGARDAISAWRRVAKRDRNGSRTSQPNGIPGYYSGGTHGHAVLIVDWPVVASTDIEEYGKVSLVDFRVIEKKWGYKWLGGAYTINNTRVYGSKP